MRWSAWTSNWPGPSCRSRCCWAAASAFRLHGCDSAARTLRAMDIFDALLKSHEVQRAICARLLGAVGDPPARDRAFEELKTELAAHETAEERTFYVPLF